MAGIEAPKFYRPSDGAAEREPNFSSPRVLICDNLDPKVVGVLTAAGTECFIAHNPDNPRGPLTQMQLMQVAGEFDALIVRSRTTITEEIIEAASGPLENGEPSRLRVIARAGVGVDNVAVNSATEHGIAVINTPDANTISAAEQTIAIMMDLARGTYKAHGDLKEEEWKSFMGIEVTGKTIGIIGFGRVGREVAKRAKGLGMKVVAADPYITSQAAEEAGVELVNLDTLLGTSNFVSLHTAVPAGQAITPILSKEKFAKMKSTAYLINVARGGFVDEDALAEAVENKTIAGAGLDVFTIEGDVSKINPRIKALIDQDRILGTAHSGASTQEAQNRVAEDIAARLIQFLINEDYSYALNSPRIDRERLPLIAPYQDVATKISSVALNLAVGENKKIKKVVIHLSGGFSNTDITPIEAAVIKGLVEPVSSTRVTLINYKTVAEHQGLTPIVVSDPTVPSPYTHLIEVNLTHDDGTATRVAGTNFPNGPRIVSLDGFRGEVPLKGKALLLLRNEDRPGMIGLVGTQLGEWDVNVLEMKVAESTSDDHQALMVLNINRPLTKEELAELAQMKNIFSPQSIPLQ